MSDIFDEDDSELSLDDLPEPSLTAINLASRPRGRWDAPVEPQAAVRAGGGGGGDPTGSRHLVYDALTPYTCDQAGMAELAVDTFGDVLAWLPDTQRFKVYREELGTWVDDGKAHEEVWRRVRDLSKQVNDAVETAVQQSDAWATIVTRNGNREEMAEARRQVASMRAWYGVFKNSGLHGVVRAVSPVCVQAAPLDFNRDPYLLNFPNGTYDVRTGELRPHRQEDRLSHRVSVPLNQALAEMPLETAAPRFHELIHRMCAAPGEVTEERHAERMAALTRWLGYQLHGANPEKKMGVIEGATDIGKNQVLEVVGQAMGNELSWLGGRPTLLIKMRGDRHDAEESRLAGMRMVVVNELTEAQHLDEGQVLRFVNPEGTTVSLRRMKQDLMDVQVTWKLNVSTNELPKARLTPQVSNRLALFKVSAVPVPKDDQWDIKGHILTHELEAVTAFLVRWWREWYVTWREPQSATGLVLTQEMREALEGYHAENRDLYEVFLDEQCELDPLATLSGPGVVWEAYQAWHLRTQPDSELRYTKGRNKFYVALEKLDGVEILRETDGRGKTRVRGLRGVRLRAEDRGGLAEMMARAH